MKKEYSVPEVEYIEFENDIVTGSTVHDGSETACTCTSFENMDFTKI